MIQVVVQVLFLPFSVLYYLIRQLVLPINFMLGTLSSNNFHRDHNLSPIQDEISDNLLEHDPSTSPLPHDFPQGMFIRIGPNQQFRPRGRHHWFDGDGMMHAVKIGCQSVRYTNKYVRTEKYNVEHQFGRSIVHGMLDCVNPIRYIDLLFMRIVYGVPFKNYEPNTANTSLTHHAGKCFASVENCLPYEIELPTLKTVGLKDLGPKYVESSFTAHPKLDAETGELIGFNYNAVRPYVSYHIFDKHGQLTHTTPISEAPRATMMHDFAITKNYTVFIFGSVVLDVYKAIAGIPFLDFKKGLPTQIAVVPRYYKDGVDKIHWFTCKPGHVFHIANAFEREDEIVMHCFRMEQFTVSLLPKENVAFDVVELGAVFYEYKMNLATGLVQENTMYFSNVDCPDSPPESMLGEFPVINSSYVGKPYQYCWVGRSPRTGQVSDAVVKLDVENLTYKEYYFGCENKRACEWTFVPSRDLDAKEDDGYVVNFLYNEKLNASTFEILNSSTLCKKSIVRFNCPRRVPYGFHGLFVRREEYEPISPLVISAGSPISPYEAGSLSPS
ncbi:carotenoid oxygenase family protein [Acrasis kona]|uniref:Carotenoid oxygenase family protein n=1 Tax=Acrasis kona TaxID=1008807 RepID=A0AAW2Z8Y5_9EUKA